ncbi:hypothetical protein DMC30DRAFT_95546 [Rhodotorula diobovata]|uniref:Uncharacterized protein n=1 Tax=Rhodotorula diobovata TaxID=5288 RepID=A0A5C5G3D3_9BASI|nr:hypothetical protein DMC30DRAFT_95546 [Rhodotorula diobovata]
MGKAAIGCPVDCSSFLISAARCGGQIVTDISITSGLSCFCEDVPTGLDECAACAGVEESDYAVSNSTARVADLIDSACGLFDMERSSTLESSEPSASSTLTSSPSATASVSVSIVTMMSDGRPFDNVVPLEQRLSYYSAISAASVASVLAANATAAATASSPPTTATVTSTAAPSVDTVSAAVQSAIAVLASASAAAAAAASASASALEKKGDSSGAATAAAVQFAGLVLASLVGATALW